MTFNNLEGQTGQSSQKKSSPGVLRALGGLEPIFPAFVSVFAQHIYPFFALI